MSSHKAEVIVVTCIDFRFQEFINEFIKDKFAPKTFDRVAFAGGVKNLDIILGQIDIAKKLHSIGKVVLINHEECGAYGDESTLEKHTEDLSNAKKQVLEKYPGLEVETFYSKLDGTFEAVS